MEENPIMSCLAVSCPCLSENLWKEFASVVPCYVLVAAVSQLNYHGDKLGKVLVGQIELVQKYCGL